MKEKKYNILYVDDEQVNLRVFRSVFRRRYQIFTAISAEEGYQILAENPIQLVITDQRMPGTTGVEFLEKIIPDYPDAVRMLLTGFADIKATVEAINKGRVYSYVNKPWSEDELGVKIENALESYELRASNKTLLDDLQEANLKLEEHAQNLEEKVKERTIQLEEQHARLLEQHREIEQKNREIVSKNIEIRKAEEEVRQANTVLEEKVRQRTADLNRSNEDFKRVNEELDLFIYRASHDLKGPVASMLGLANLAKLDGADPKNILECLNRIELIGEGMNRTLSKLEMISAVNQKSNIRKKINLESLLSRSIAHYRKEIRENKIQVSFDFSPDYQLVTHPDLFRMIFSNITENAIHFRKKSGETPILNVVSLREDDLYIVRIEDNGIGIAEEFHQKIYAMFFRGSEASAGNGLGLYIAGKAAEALSAEIRLRSEPGKGSVFEIILPVNDDTETDF